jgi:cytoskeletal protein CcmA (bactofilin family)
MWRKPNDAKPSENPKVPTINPVVPLPAPVETAPVAETPVPAPAAVPVAPVYAAAPVKTVVAPTSSGGTSIGSGLKIRGELSGSSDLFIDGEAQGKITLADSRVTVGPNGRVQADIEAREIIIEGTVQGNLNARESVRLGPCCKVQGSIVTPRIGIEDGAGLRGKVEMLRPTETSKSPKPSAAAAQAAAAPAFKAVSAAAESEQRSR